MDDDYIWLQGPIPLNTSTTAVSTLGATISGLGRQNTEDSCVIGTTTVSDCRDGDHAYATSTLPGNAHIFKPAEERAIGTAITRRNFSLATSSVERFEIVVSRPPARGDEVNKVGRTTGWSSAELSWVATYYSSCPGAPVYLRDNEIDDDEHMKCLARAEYISEKGDSGSPVFARKTSSSTEVYLVGVHYYGRSKFGNAKRFMPIDRVYAESLSRGYDWKPTELRVAPAIDDINSDKAVSEDLLMVSSQGRSEILARFHAEDFSSPVLHYRAALFRNGVRVTSVSETSRFGTGTMNGVSLRYASFDISGLSASQKAGKFTVALRACTDTTFTTCGDYGHHGDTLTLP